MKSFFKELFEYSHHYNQKLTELIHNHPDQISDKALSLFSHILNAQQIWNNRINPKQKPFGVWELQPVKDLKSIDQRNFEQSLEIVEKFDLNQTMSYKNSKGQAFENSIRNLLFHIINHSTYHRAQIATEFRQQGLEPLSTDFIHFRR
jgi:uncharacterized damage-inducible protein DinB